MSDELLPCPFCGGGASSWTCEDPTGELNYTCGCPSCGMLATDDEDWNRRAPAPLAWTSEPPTVPGWYMFRAPVVQRPFLIRVMSTEYQSPGHYFGPIPEPQEPTP